MNEQRTKALKTVLQLVCQIQWLVGLMVALSGVYLLLKYKQSSLFFSHSYIALPVLFIFASAAFLLASGFLGSWVSIRDSVCLQGMFVYLLVVVFCLGSTAAALAYYHSIKLESDLQPLSGVFKNYTGNSQDRQSWAATPYKKECVAVVSMDTGIGGTHPGLIALEVARSHTAAAIAPLLPAMAVCLCPGSFTNLAAMKSYSSPFNLC